MKVQVWECRACGCRYPIAIYYPAAAGHGPDRRCRAPWGWKVVLEDYPPDGSYVPSYPPQ